MHCAPSIDLPILPGRAGHAGHAVHAGHAGQRLLGSCTCFPATQILFEGIPTLHMLSPLRLCDIQLHCALLHRSCLRASPPPRRRALVGAGGQVPGRSFPHCLRFWAASLHPTCPMTPAFGCWWQLVDKHQASGAFVCCSVPFHIGAACLLAGRLKWGLVDKYVLGIGIPGQC